MFFLLICHYTTPQLHRLPSSDRNAQSMSTLWASPREWHEAERSSEQQCLCGSNACHRNHNRHQGVSHSSYKGKQAKSKDHVYDVGGIRGGNDLFDKTTHEIADFVSRSIKGGGEFQTAIDPDDLGFQPLIKPPFPDDDADELEVEWWKLRIRCIDKRRAMQDELMQQVCQGTMLAHRGGPDRGIP